ncbi:MAG: hypothetical protein KAJ51_13560, partial [Thermoplasmata archaeon]|nr:hypothetical protein [Thermoplasmata archaeon]
MNLIAKKYEDDHSNVINDNIYPLSNEYSMWDPIEVVSEPIPGQNINIGSSSSAKVAVENDKIYVVWEDNSSIQGSGSDRDIFYRHFDGNKWSEIQVISEPVHGNNFNDRISDRPAIAVENGKIYVIWCDMNNTNGAGLDVDTFYRTNLTGTHWEEVQVISEPVVGSNFNIRAGNFPQIAVENGKIYVIWHDRNNTNGAGTDIDLFYRCNLTGKSWEDIQVISEPVMGNDINIGESTSRPSIAVENSKIYVIWEDTNDTNSAGTD